VTIGNSEINGLGLFATEVILSQETIGITHGIWEGNIWRTPLGGFINHANKPNCQLIQDGNIFSLKTIAVIKPGTEITVHYSMEQQ